MYTRDKCKLCEKKNRNTDLTCKIRQVIKYSPYAENRTIPEYSDDGFLTC